ncbi:hypothetical protein P153DRAFT_332420 [Dothidotthia symphoricarpi CBS 119687]|uniref:Zn(2)-C6 fungal-type domain-containing protein n=1 Tax=Dothidotthia symphoricarpi CBS 119687 TaxID=1392245 RepID=A0A6A6AQQ0_9PLEO|nr:uncharacterized protein P153DRAFT_332420 [Dothidotthia symphoricarpi CBS 119687]KAF2133533.1 hypothetical protein P153DRAFT_332420 [Dothidotthia symphoricarpi CBS 119687]
MPAQGQAKRRRASQATDGPAKRTRVSRACDQCRVAREKCDGVQPMCSSCSMSSRGCTYTANPKKRGIQPGYIRALELALAWLFQLNADDETSLNDKLAQGGASSLLLSRDSKESNRLHKKWRKSSFYRDVDKLLSGGETSRHEPAEPLSPRSDDEDSDVDEMRVPPVIQGEDFDQGKQDEAGPGGLLHQPSSAFLPHVLQSPNLVSLPPDCWRLLETYFTYIQSWFPISEKHDLLKLSYSYPAQGLPVSPDLPESGAHAELWSILAAASIYDGGNMSQFEDQDHPSKTTPRQLYDTAKAWIPNEFGGFDLGHVKALLNLAIFNVSQSSIEPAWLLVGCASRILERMNNASLNASSRLKHTVAGCFILDTILALQLGRRSYFQRSDLKQLGSINEDNIEEWQPWTGGQHTSSQQQARIPVMSISSFNCLVEIVDILASCEEQLSSGFSADHASQRFEIWKASLPPKLDYLRFDNTTTPLTPPAILLQLASCTTALSLAPSEPRFHQILQMLERAQEHIGLASLPPVTSYLLGIIRKYSARLTTNQALHARIERLHLDIAQTWQISSSALHTTQIRTNETSKTLPRRSITAMQMPTPDSVHNPLSRPQTVHQTAATGIIQTMPTPHNSIVPDLHTTSSLYQPDDAFLGLHSPVLPDPRYPNMTNDLENFFDDLASLDSTNRLEHQPQFMQNLGFAPDANMSDLFGDYMPLQSSAFVAQENHESMPFDQYSFFDGS